MRRILLAILGWASLAAPAAAQSYDASKLWGLCRGVGGQYMEGEIKDTGYIDPAEKAVLEAVGARPDQADRPEVKARIAAMFRHQASLPPNDSRLYCDGGVSFGIRSTVLYVAARANDPTYQMKRLIAWGVDINFRDARTGHTMLDDLRDHIARGARDSELKASVRLSYEHSMTLTYSTTYERLRRLGARHAGEVVARASCGATAADAPAPGIAFDGAWAARGSGPTPQQIPGVHTITPRQLACMLNTPHQDVLLLAAMPDELAVPRSQNVWWASSGTGVDDARQAPFADFMRSATSYGANKDRPIVVYCHHNSCLLSYNVLLRLKAAGYPNLYWMREGVRAWREAGYPMGPNIPTLRDGSTPAK